VTFTVHKETSFTLPETMPFTVTILQCQAVTLKRSRWLNIAPLKLCIFLLLCTHSLDLWESSNNHYYHRHTPVPWVAAMVYKIDYASEVPQASSTLCSLPDEILLNIFKGFFTDLSFEFRTHTNTDGKSCSTQLLPAETFGVVNLDEFLAAKSFDMTRLSIFRCCKALRRKLLPELFKNMCHTMPITYYGRDAHRNLLIDSSAPIPHFANYASRLLSMPLPPRVCDTITKLEMSGNTQFLFDVLILKNLQEIVVYILPPLCLEHSNALNNYDDTLLLSRWALQEELDHQQRNRVLTFCRWNLNVPIQMPNRWIVEFAAALKSRKTHKDLRLNVLHYVSVCRLPGPDPAYQPWGGIQRDMLTNKITVIRKNKSEEGPPPLSIEEMKSVYLFERPLIDEDGEKYRQLQDKQHDALVEWMFEGKP
jgi:hypothetical protein